MDDVYLGAVIELGERMLETAFAQVAPGANHVGPDLDLHLSILRGAVQRPSSRG
jgi:hypothetical protein